MKFEPKYKTLHSKNCIWKYRRQKATVLSRGDKDLVHDLQFFLCLALCNTGSFSWYCDPNVFVNLRCIFIFMDIYADTKSIGHSMIYFNLIDTSTKHMKWVRVYCTHIDRLLVMLAFNDIQHVSGIYPAIGLYFTCHFRNETERIRI